MGDIGVTRHVAATATGQTTFANDLSATAAAISCPSGHIRALGVSISKSITDVAGAGGTFGIRLVGGGIPNGQQDFTMGGLTSDTTSTGGAKYTPPFYLTVDITCTPGQTVTASVFENGVDMGTAEVELTLIFN